MLNLARFSKAATAKLGRPGYAGSTNASSGPQTAHLCDMPSTTTEAAEERPARKAKKESKLCTFLTRSRSRSRSKVDLSLSPKINEPSRKTESSGSKPPHRIPSRPLSSTTSSTVTPSTPKARKKPSSSIPVPTPKHPTNDITNPRKKINLFGISIRRPSLGSSKSRSRSRSRPGTPQQSADVPPLPTFGFEEDSRGLPQAQTSQPSLRPSSPTPLDRKSPHGKQHSAKPLFDRSLPQPPANNVSPDAQIGSPTMKEYFAAKDSRRVRHHTLPTPTSLVSAPVKQGPSSQRQSSKTTAGRPAADSHAPPPSSLNSNIPKLTTSGAPRIVQTPATPVRSATVPERKLSTAVAAASKSAPGRKNYSLDTGYRYRGTMDIVNEEGGLSMASNDILVSRINSKIKGKEKEMEPVSVHRSKSRVNANVRSTRHGSFDFERPGVNIVGMQRTTSNRTVTSAASGWSQSGDEIIARESAFGPGLAGVGTLQRETSMKRGKDREVKEREIQKEAAKKDTPARIHEGSQKSNASPAHSSNGHQTPPSATNSAKSSSLGRISGRRFLGKGLSTSRASTQHGLFSFEPPVPSPTWSAPSTSTTKEVSSQSGRKEKKTERTREENESSIDIKTSQGRDRPPISLPQLPIGTRSGRKGRSLDLNLGLAWAPSKVREDALLSTSLLFHRSINNTSNLKSTPISASANNSPDSKDPASKQVTLEEKSKIGRETAELFRNVLGEARYMRFKTYIYQFDAREIPFDGPTGIISRVDALLSTVQTLGLNEKRRLMDKLVRIILQNA
ncbi:hypothetical protein AGABI2DRAFT_177960 [Agaricus bisporus var. bisporus H97]|uniref:hypothetical protein n=1 Tax=Agaricus bisporus var. bisporus (strain H97 / ATCC MYA-4626 / FGSC 10389) TaxID=936046 RepID=UPI00029F523E|nr:hypothetical protein AGABI2DRAFT_177960 [Agaricus bisporus var. bisporus H97]EKV48512.1 hypothetical protein AGABI2DRAFT_177960 [Agaricus bisporus var. bisporus H97]